MIGFYLFCSSILRRTILLISFLHISWGFAELIDDLFFEVGCFLFFLSRSFIQVFSASADRRGALSDSPISQSTRRALSPPSSRESSGSAHYPVAAVAFSRIKGALDKPFRFHPKTCFYHPIPVSRFLRRLALEEVSSVPFFSPCSSFLENTSQYVLPPPLLGPLGGHFPALTLILPNVHNGA